MICELHTQKQCTLKETLSLPYCLNDLPSYISHKTFNQNPAQCIFTSHATGKAFISNNNGTLGWSMPTPKNWWRARNWTCSLGSIRVEQPRTSYLNQQEIPSISRKCQLLHLQYLLDISGDNLPGLSSHSLPYLPLSLSATDTHPPCSLNTYRMIPSGLPHPVGGVHTMAKMTVMAMVRSRFAFHTSRFVMSPSLWACLAVNVAMAATVTVTVRKEKSVK